MSSVAVTRISSRRSAGGSRRRTGTVGIGELQLARERWPAYYLPTVGEKRYPDRKQLSHVDDDYPDRVLLRRAAGPAGHLGGRGRGADVEGADAGRASLALGWRPPLLGGIRRRAAMDDDGFVPAALLGRDQSSLVPR